MRITDTTLKRLVQVLEFVYQQKAIVTHQKIGNLITAKEHEEGYKYTVCKLLKNVNNIELFRLIEDL